MSNNNNQIFDKVDFFEADNQETSKTAHYMGQVAMALLHLIKVAFLVYSGYHGINAAGQYAAAGEMGQAAQVVGVLVLELTLAGLYVAWHTQRITGIPQSIAAGTTYMIGFTLAALGILADSQINAGIALSGWLSFYLSWGLPLAPLVMAVGALLTHELAPSQLSKRRLSILKADVKATKAQAELAEQLADLREKKAQANFVLNARLQVINQVADWLDSDEAKQAMALMAAKNAPALFRSIGIDVPALSEPEPVAEPDPVAEGEIVPASPTLPTAEGIIGGRDFMATVANGVVYQNGTAPKV